ncbi:MAG: hypothetical protein AB8B72_10655, partial [Crocinitomicaceae bacterium]
GLNNICQTNQFDIVVEEPSELIMQSVMTPEAAGQDGSISVQAIGGTPDYSYLWSNGSVDSLIMNLSAGNYTVLITDTNGCETSKSFDLLSVLAIDEVIAETEFIYFADENRVLLQGELEQLYTLYDLNGKMIQEYEINSGSEHTNLAIPSSLAKGTYFLIGINSSFKIVK